MERNGHTGSSVFQRKLRSFCILSRNLVCMVKNCRSHIINCILIQRFGHYDRRLDCDGFYRLILSRIGSCRNLVGCIIWTVTQDRIPDRAINIDHIDTIGSCKLCDSCCRCTCNNKRSINFSILQRFLAVLKRQILGMDIIQGNAACI